jgi:pimeloyl-ACP methyl ester carboxylesterase
MGNDARDDSRAFGRMRWALAALVVLGATTFVARASADGRDHDGRDEDGRGGHDRDHDGDDGHDHDDLRCRRMNFDVAQTPGGPTDNRMAAWLCARGSIENKTIQILIHGATFDHNYWDFPYRSDKYSYVDYMTKAGYAVLSLDRIGYGESSHPASGASVTLHTGAFTIHQVVQSLRSRRLRVPGFGRIEGERIELVGFSIGSFISILESSTWHDVDGVVLSSYSHTVGAGGIASFGLVIPAPQDPKFATFPADYLSEAPGAREFLFYHLPNIEQRVIDIDERLRQTWTVGELNDIVPSLAEPADMHVPVLVVDGDWDTIACNTPCSATNWLANEASFYPADTCAEVKVIPDAGHSLALHRNARSFFSTVHEWSDRRVGPRTNRPPPQRCNP